MDAAIKELAPLHKFAVKSGSGARLLAAYYVFTFSQLEVYVKSIVEDSLDALNASGPAFDKWPDLAIGYLLHRGENLAADYRKFGTTEDEGALLVRVAETARKIASWSSGAASLTAADAAIFLDKKKYPSPKNLPQLFRRLGITKLWALVDSAGKFNGELILTSLNDLRTGIAHEGHVPPGFSLVDFRERVRQMRHLVSALDRAVATHFCPGVISRPLWNSAMV